MMYRAIAGKTDHPNIVSAEDEDKTYACLALLDELCPNRGDKIESIIRFGEDGEVKVLLPMERELTFTVSAV